MTTHKITRELPGEYGEREFCTLEVELKDNRDGLPALSICGVHGYILTPRQARKEALRYWESYFDDDANNIKDMNERCNTNFRSSTSAAKYVLANDGEYHGLDVVYVEGAPDNKVYVCTSCGQIREELLKFFPEIAPVLKYHLNDMVASKDGSEWLYRPLPKDVKAFGTDPAKWLAEHPVKPTVAENITQLLAPA